MVYPRACGESSRRRAADHGGAVRPKEGREARTSSLEPATSATTSFARPAPSTVTSAPNRLIRISRGLAASPRTAASRVRRRLSEPDRDAGGRPIGGRHSDIASSPHSPARRAGNARVRAPRRRRPRHRWPLTTAAAPHRTENLREHVRRQGSAMRVTKGSEVTRMHAMFGCQPCPARCLHGVEGRVL
jgi:hypothetical protein